jgi:undecaprenyl-diphosphatase
MNQMIHKIQVWDDRTILQVIARRGSILTKFMKFVSSMGDGYLWAALSIIFFYFLELPNTWLLTGLTAFAIELICYKIIKQSTSRQRPFRANASIQNLVVPQDEYSFPSGHTAAATVAALLFSTAVPFLIPFFSLLVLLIGISRIYLGVHYPSDVLMGFTLGVMSFSFAILFF